ncbi:MAG: trigger factor, partial [Glaciihabitans sp.]|nr:trigger factor [Glaciihabitans sp.]
EFIKVLDQNGQIPAMIGEVARAKALAIVLDKAEVVDSNGDKVDISEFTATMISNEDDDSELFDTSDATNLLEQANDHDHDDHAGHSH